MGDMGSPMIPMLTARSLNLENDSAGARWSARRMRGRHFRVAPNDDHRRFLGPQPMPLDGGFIAPAAFSRKSVTGFGGWRCLLQSVELTQRLAFLGLHVDLAPRDKSDLAEHIHATHKHRRDWIVGPQFAAV